MIVPSDLYRIAVVAGPAITPDGGTVVYRRTSFDRERDAAGGALWRVDRDGEPQVFTSGRSDRMPRIAPDGTRVAFVRDVADGAQLHVIALAGGEAQPIGATVTGVTSLAWSPDGTSLAYTAIAPHDAATAHIALDEPSGARHIRALPYKSDAGGLLDGRRTQVFVVALADGAARQLTHGDADAGDVAWSPDGRTIVYSLDGAREASGVGDIALVDVASGTHRVLTAGDGPAGMPVFSPDGTMIAWFGHRHGSDTRMAGELFVTPAAGGVSRSLSAALDRHIGNVIGGDLRSGAAAPPVWRGNERVFALASDGGTTPLRSFDVGAGTCATIVGGEREIYAFACADDGTIALAYATATVPSELALLTPEGERRLTTMNAWLADADLAVPRRITAHAGDGRPLDAWIMLPTVAASAAPPVVLEIHGGPHAAYGATFSLEFQLLAACGFAVVYGNPRGGAGYGQAFASAISGDWGGIDASDVLAILDAALASEALDGSRVAAVGGSYGGFMTTWLLGHTTRFVTGISERALNEYLSFTLTSDIAGYFLDAEMGFDCSPSAMDTMMQRSPLRAAQHIDVPLLIIHSERDFRCPVGQGESLFALLRMLGKRDVEFVRFTGDGHELSRGGKPRHRVLRLRAIARWLLRHLAGQRSDDDARAGSLFVPLPGEAESDAPTDQRGASGS